jgi:hypothetical protein
LSESQNACNIPPLRRSRVFLVLDIFIFKTFYL